MSLRVWVPAVTMAVLFMRVWAGTNGSAASSEKHGLLEYGGSASCRECHAEAFKAWTDSNHALAERQVSAILEKPAFAPPRRFEHAMQYSEVYWTNGSGCIRSLGLSGTMENHSVARVIGNWPLRQFLVSFPGGRFQVAEAAFDPRSNQWFNVYGNEDRAPGEWGHWTGRGMTWNYMCAGCHNTQVRRNYDEATDTYRTTMAEGGVGCESCHGPLAKHQQWQKQFGQSGQTDPTVPRQTRAQVLDYCGSCHARRTELTGDFQAGDHFLDHFELVLPDHSQRYFADGQVRDEDYEYGSFLGSRMHVQGVTCTDCHNPHSLKTLLPGNWLCLRCHSSGVANAPIINPVAHSHHKVFGFNTNGQPATLEMSVFCAAGIKETGGQCINCHMPQTVYMQRHWRHDHGFTSPDPLLTKQFGIPNACNRCHQDKDADWAFKYCEEWYGAKMDRPARGRALAVARALRGETEAKDQLLAWLPQEASPYWQAVIVELLSEWSDRPAVATAVFGALGHTNGLVRTAAATALERALRSGNSAAVEALRQRLQDPLRSVRVATAFALGCAFDDSARAACDLKQYLAVNADEPSGQFQTSVYFFSRNEPQKALLHLEKAAAWDPNSAAIRRQLAVVLSALARPREAVKMLEQACRLEPDAADTHYALGLAYNESGDLTNAIKQLALAVQLEPRHARGWYNLGLAQDAAGQTNAALDSLLRAQSADPEDPRIPYARATILARLGRNDEARLAVRQALELDTAFADAQQLLELLSR